MNKCMSFCVVLILLGCGESKSEPRKQLCGGGVEPVLTLRFDSNFHQLPLVRGMFVENGHSFVTLNGNCEFWTWGYVPKEKRFGSDMRVKIRTGTLNEEQLTKLKSMLKWERWPDIYGTSLPSNADGGDGFYSGYAEGSEFFFSIRRINDDQLRTDIASGLHDATKYLYELGEPIETKKLRIFVNQEYPESAWIRYEVPPLYVEWPDFGVSVKELAEKQNTYCVGKSFLVEDENAVRVFSEAREAYAEILETTFPAAMGVINEDGGKHELYIRDVLPFENELGLVQQGGFGGEVCF